jgi:hypothetical protein
MDLPLILDKFLIKDLVNIICSYYYSCYGCEKRLTNETSYFLTDFNYCSKCYETVFKTKLKKDNVIKLLDNIFNNDNDIWVPNNYSYTCNLKILKKGCEDLYEPRLSTMRDENRRDFKNKLIEYKKDYDIWKNNCNYYPLFEEPKRPELKKIDSSIELKLKTIETRKNRMSDFVDDIENNKNFFVGAFYNEILLNGKKPQKSCNTNKKKINPYWEKNDLSNIFLKIKYKKMMDYVKKFYHSEYSKYSYNMDWTDAYEDMHRTRNNSIVAQVYFFDYLFNDDTDKKLINFKNIMKILLNDIGRHIN